MPDSVAALHAEQEILQKIAAIPSVSSVGTASAVPMAGTPYRDPIWTADDGDTALPNASRFVTKKAFTC